jgi:uncharacterized protein (TIGR02246 family)
VTEDEQSIRDNIETWHRATARGDVDTVLELMSRDVEFYVAGQPPMKGREAFRTGLQQLLETHRIESAGDVREVRVDGDLACCLTHLDVKVTAIAGGGANERNGSSLSVFQREGDGKWRLLRDANLLGGSAKGDT